MAQDGLNSVQVTYSTNDVKAICECGWQFSNSDAGTVHLSAAKHLPCTKDVQ